MIKTNFYKIGILIFILFIMIFQLQNHTIVKLPNNLSIQQSNHLTTYPLFLIMPPLPEIFERPTADGKGMRLATEILPRIPRTFDKPSKVVRPFATDSVKALVILIDFPSGGPWGTSYSGNGSKSQAEFESALFEPNNNHPASMRDFYLENSYGAFNMTGTVTQWVHSSRSYDYYCDSDHINGTNDDNGFDIGKGEQNVFGLVKEAVSKANPPGGWAQFDTRDPFDRNGNGNLNEPDGYIDVLFIVHSGPGAEAIADDNTRGRYIWSHKANVEDADWSITTPDGSKKVDVYSMEPEIMPGGSLVTIGVFCHEAGHVFGLPDLYDTDYSSDGIGRWGIMAAGSWLGPDTDGDGKRDLETAGSNPAHFSAWSKYFLGWVSPTIIDRKLSVKELLNESIPPVETNPRVYMLINDEDNKPWREKGGKGEFFLVENRQTNAGIFDRYLPSSGLLIWHIDESMPDNDNDKHRLVALMRNGSDELSTKGEKSDPWDIGKVFDNSSVASSKFYNGMASGVEVSNIRAGNSGAIIADLKVGAVLLGEVLSYPNPFVKRGDDKVLTIEYRPTDEKELAGTHPDIKVTIFTVAGQLVRVLDRKTGPNPEVDPLARRAYWDGKNNDGSEVATGMYYYIIIVGKDKAKGKITFIH